MRAGSLFIFLVIFLAGCGLILKSKPTSPPSELSFDGIRTSVPRLPTPTAHAKIVTPNEQTGTDLQSVPGLFQPLRFDSIHPVYNPKFVNGIDSSLQPEELVIGISIGKEAKAYPITVLRFREMVNDEIAGVPILVTW